MKKVIFLILISIVLSSCSTDVKFNNPGFQGYKDDVLWRGIDVTAYVSQNGRIRILALAQDEEVELKIASSNIGTYYFGTSNLNTKATYVSTFDNNYLYYGTDPIPGSVAKIASPLVSGGTGYANATGVATTGGSGTGLTVKTTVNTAGVITDVQVSSAGNNYVAGDLITISGGGNDAKFRVLNVEGSNGEIKITNYSGGTISGTFKFNAKNIYDNPFGGELVNFQYGEFYKVNVIPEP